METAEQFIKRKEKQFSKDLLNPKSTIKMKDISRQGFHIFKREGWTFMVQHNLHEKAFLIERLKKIDQIGVITHKELRIGDIEYRIGYFMIGRNGTKKGIWTWGQYCPIIPQDDFDKLFKKAREEKTII